jgi:hypothetical protein
MRYGLKFAFVIIALTEGCGGRLKPNFSGTWDLSLSTSRLESSPPDSSTFYIEHHEPSFRLKRTHVFNGKPYTWGIDLITEGKEVEQREKDGTPFRARLTWEGDALIFNSYWLDGEPRTTNIVKYTLSKDGNIFTADEHLAGKKVNHHNVWVFNREKPK